MIHPGDEKWIERALKHPDDHPVLAPALKRIQEAGVSRDDLVDVVRVMQFQIVDHVCYMLDSIALPGTVPIQDFGVYVVGGGDSPTTDKSIVRLESLHEQVGSWDPSQPAEV